MATRGADSPGMQDFEASCQEGRADWVRLLCAYAQAEEVAAAAEAVLKAANPSKGFPGRKKKGTETAEAPAPAVEPVAVESVPVETVAASEGSAKEKDGEAEDSSTGWVSRIGQLEGIDPSQMSTLHGRVIALGYLKFQLIDRQVGLRYRLTPAGKQIVKAEPAEKVAA